MTTETEEDKGHFNQFLTDEELNAMAELDEDEDQLAALAADDDADDD